jgi:DNA-binding transcriptional LysR family regulator
MLGRHPLAVLSGSEIAAVIEGEAEKKGVRLNVCLRGSSYAQLIEAVRQIGCAAVLPTFAVQVLESTSEVLPLSALKAFTRPMAIAWNPRSCALRPTVTSAIASLTSLLRQNLGSAA